MMAEAVRLKLLKDNPCREVKKLKEEETEREILTAEEAANCSPGCPAVWENPVAYKAHRLAACTGPRIGELRGLLDALVFDDYICVTGQYGRFGYAANTKTKHNRNIPITPLIWQELEELSTKRDNCGLLAR